MPDNFVGRPWARLKAGLVTHLRSSLLHIPLNGTSKAQAKIVTQQMVTNSDFTYKTRQTLRKALRLAKEYANAEASPVHLAFALINDGTQDGTLQDMQETTSLLAIIIRKAGGDPTAVGNALKKLLAELRIKVPPPDEVTFSSASLKVLRRAQSLRKKMHDHYVAQDHLIRALMTNSTVSTILKEIGLTEIAVIAAVDQIRRGSKIKTRISEPGFNALNAWALDLTARAKEGIIKPLIGCDDEIQQVIQILCQRTKNTPVLIGEPGIGRKSIIEGLAKRIVNRDVPVNLNVRLYSLDLEQLMALVDTPSEYERQVRSIIKEAMRATRAGGPEVILFIDELHLIMENRGGFNTGKIIKRFLASGRLRCISATTSAQYEQYIRADNALECRLAQVVINEPSVASTINILRDMKPRYELYYGIRIMNGALTTAVTLAHRYLSSKRLPDSAIELVDEACANIHVQRQTGPEEIGQLQRRQLELAVETRALQRETVLESRERLQQAEKERKEVEERLERFRAVFKNDIKRGNKIVEMRKKVDTLRVEAEDAEQHLNLARASNLKFYEIPDLKALLEQAEAQEASEVAANGGGTNTVVPEQIAKIVSCRTGILVTRLMSSEHEKLLGLEKILEDSVVGQAEAVKVIANTIRVSRSGLSNSNRPVASFLVAGPPGTGKTLLAKTLATSLFDSPNAMIQIDAAEYPGTHPVGRLIGAAPGTTGHDAGGQLTEYIRLNPYSVVLISNIEKASPEFVSLFLQVVEDGRLTDSRGRVVDFRNVIIIMTSNLGAAHLSDVDNGPIKPAIKSLVKDIIEAYLPSEFISRIDELVTFRALSGEDILKIVDICLKEVEEQLANRKIKFDVDDESRNYLASVGYLAESGARHMSRAIQTEVLSPLAIMLLSERVRDGEIAQVRFNGEMNKLEILPNHAQDTMDIVERQQ